MPESHHAIDFAALTKTQIKASSVQMLYELVSASGHKQPTSPWRLLFGQLDQGYWSLAVGPVPAGAV